MHISLSGQNVSRQAPPLRGQLDSARVHAERRECWLRPLPDLVSFASDPRHDKGNTIRYGPASPILELTDDVGEKQKDGLEGTVVGGPKLVAFCGSGSTKCQNSRQRTVSASRTKSEALIKDDF